MIVVCEPLCRGFSHEKVNSGFLRSLRLAFPEEHIRVYADASHLTCLREILAHDGISIEDIEYRPIRFGNEFTFCGALGYRRLLSEVFSETLLSGTDKIFFLSFSSILLHLVKRLKSRRQFATMKFAFVLHGQYEDIVDDPVQSPGFEIPKPAVSLRIRNSKLIRVPGSALRYAGNRARALWKGAQKRTLLSLFPLGKMMLWRHSQDCRYIALAPHVLENSRRYLDVEAMNFHMVPMPTTFAAPLPLPANAFPKFAVFGFGNPPVLHQVLLKLSLLVPEGVPYEVRIVGMDNRGTSGFPNVTAPSQGKPMSRPEMEAQVQDIDAFLSLYTKESYRVSCSGSIFEALSYMKPILHFDNETMNAFNRVDRPIGFRSDSVAEYAGRMADIINNYAEFMEEAKRFRANLSLLRSEFSIERWAPELREAFTWPLAREGDRRP